MDDRMSWKRYIPLGVFVLFSLTFLLRPLMDLDEVWNFNFARCIQDGLRPYLDLNMVQTPLSAYLAAFVLAIFGDSLMVFRLLGAALFVAVFGGTYLLGCRFTTAAFSFVVTVFLTVICSVVWIYDYNHLMLALILAILGLEYERERATSGTASFIHMMIGALCGIAPLIKQSTGAILFLCNLGSCVHSSIRREEPKYRAICRAGISVVPLIVFAVSLQANHCWEGFMDQAVLGIRTFTHVTSPLEAARDNWVVIVLLLFPVAVTGWSMYSLVKGKNQPHRAFLIRSLLWCWAGTVVAYPICDLVHLSVAVVPFMVPVLCCIGQIRSSAKDRAACWVVAGVLLCTAVAMALMGLSSYERCTLRHFEGVPVDSRIQGDIEFVDAYILEKAEDGLDVIITNADAAVYMIPLDRYHKYFDLMLVGNMGTKTAEELLWREDVVYLVPKEPGLIGDQTHVGVLDTIRHSYLKIGEVAHYEAYMPQQEEGV